MPDPEPVKKRRRPPLSCEQCRKRKIKCDRSYPCNNCAKSNTETCTYAPTQIPKSRRRPGRNKARASPPEANSAPVSLRPAGYADFGGVLPTTGATLLETPDSEQFHRTSVWQPLRASSATKPASSGAAGSRGSVGANQSHAAVNGAEYGTEFESGHANNAAGEQQPSQYTPPPKGSISKGRYFGQSHWMNIAASFPVELSMLKSQEHTQGELFHVLRQCKVICKNIKKSRLPPISSGSIGKTVVSKELANDLVGAYLRTYEGVFRILHVPTFRLEYASYWEDPSSAHESFVILLQLCMVLGTSVRQSTPDLKASSIRWIYEAAMWLMLPPEKSRMTLTGVQIMCLLSLSKTICGVSADLTWVMSGSMLRTAMYMGLHRDPSHLSEMTLYKAEMRRRLWATILELNLQYAFEAGGLPLISCDDYDTLPPADLDDEQLDDSIDDVRRRVTSSSVATQMSIPLEVFRSFPLRLKLLQYINNFRTDFNYEETLRLNSDLTKACRSFTQRIGSLTRRPDGNTALPYPNLNGSIKSFHISLAEISLYRCFHALHFPVLFSSFDDPRFYFSRKMCLDGALKIADLWHFSQPGPRNRSESPQSDFECLTINGTGIFKNIPIQAVCIIALELIHNKSGRSSGLGYLPAVGNSDLRACLDEALNWTMKRMQAGELTAKGHCFLSACIAHVVALDQGMDKTATMALLVQKATEAAKEDLALLKDVARESGVPVDEEPELLQQQGVETGILAGGTMEALAAGWDANWAWDENDDWMWGGAWSQLNVTLPVDDVNQFFETPAGYPR